MAATIPVYDTVTGARMALVDAPRPGLLQDRYFPTVEPLDLFVTKDVFFDIDKGDFKRMSFFSCGYGTADVLDWTADTVIPPRVAEEDPLTLCKTKDRRIFERFSYMQGQLTPNHATALNDVMMYKASRLVNRAARSIESLCALVFKENGVNISIENSPNDSNTRDIRLNYWYKGNGTSASDPTGSTIAPNPQVYKSKLWSQTVATPIEDVREMCILLEQHGTIPEDLLLSQAAWKKLEDDMASRGLMMPWQVKYTVIANGPDADKLFSSPIDGARFVAVIQIGGYVLNVIVYSGAYEDDNGDMVRYFDDDFVCVTRPKCGHTLCGGVTLPNIKRILTANPGQGIISDFYSQIAGKYILSHAVNTVDGTTYVRCESNPLPAPLWPWAWITLEADD